VLELVDVIAGLAAEQDGELLGVVGDRMHHERGRLGRQPIGPVLDRQADENRGGWIETWVANPIKQPSRSSPWAAVRSTGSSQAADKPCEILVNGPHP
jgi:hypothetical protein